MEDTCGDGNGEMGQNIRHSSQARRFTGSFSLAPSLLETMAVSFPERTSPPIFLPFSAGVDVLCDKGG